MSIQQWEDRSAMTLATTQDVAVQRLAEWAQSADAAYQVAERLAGSAFVPAQFKNKPVELTAAILSGLEVGLSPMAAMRSFDIISGQAAPRAITLRAVVQSHGHEMVLVESSTQRCRMKGRRKGSEEWQTVTWDMTRAQGLGLVGKDNWKKQPGAMLLARATSELARLIASDAILGIGYSSEEVADGGSFDQQVGGDTTTPAASTGTRKMSRPAPQNSDPAEAPDVPADVVERPDSAGSELLSDSTRGRMFALMGELGIKDDQDQRDFLTDTLGRPVESRASLTEAEGVAAGKRLRRIEQGDPDAEWQPVFAAELPGESA